MTFDMPRPQDKLAMVKRIALFSSCTDEQVHLVAERSRLVEYKKGEVVYREGDRADAFYLVASGRLEVSTILNGQKHVYAVLHNGDIFGEISLLTGETHSATVEALNDTLVLQLEKRDFDELINRIPSLAVSLSRLLSKRLRTKSQASGPGEAMVVAIYSAAKGVGRTLFAAALATVLRRESDRRVIVVDFSTPQGETNAVLGSLRGAQPLSSPVSGLWSEGSLDQQILEHPLGFHLLYAGQLTAGGHEEQMVAPLVSELAKRYSYILMDLPAEVDAAVVKALTQADLIYLVSDCAKENLLRTKALMRQVREAISSMGERMKVVLNLMECAGERISPSEIGQFLERPVGFVLPHIESPEGELTAEELARLLQSRESAYTATVRRIARELGGMLVGLALGSGAALGLAHIGVLKVIEREKIPVDLVAGSSVGALIGALWASGKSAEDLEQLSRQFQNPWKVRSLFLDIGIPLFSIALGLAAGVLVGWLAGLWTGLLFGSMVTIGIGLVFGPLSGGPLQGARVMQFIEEGLGDKTFEETRVPLKIIASNPLLREEIVFDSGRLADAVRASISIPGIFKPVRWMGKICLDGGVANPIPVSVLRRAGAKRIIAVNVFPTSQELITYAQESQQRRAQRDAQLASKNLVVRLTMLLRRELVRSMSPLVFDVIMRSMQSMEHQIAEVACHEADVVLRPTVPGSHWLEFYHPEKFIRRGEEEALQHVPHLRRLVSAESPALTSSPSLGTIQA
jgi:NTE family protein